MLYRKCALPRKPNSATISCDVTHRDPLPKQYACCLLNYCEKISIHVYLFQSPCLCASVFNFTKMKQNIILNVKIIIERSNKMKEKYCAKWRIGAFILKSLDIIALSFALCFGAAANLRENQHRINLLSLIIFPDIFLRPRSRGFMQTAVYVDELIGLNRPQFNIHFMPYRDATRLTVRINCSAFKKQFHFARKVTAEYESKLSSPDNPLN